MIRLGVLGSTRGTHLLSIIDAIQNNTLSASIEIVLSNKADALILERASSLGLNAEYLNPKDLNRSEYDEKISTLLQQHRVDLVVLIGYMRILSTEFVRSWHHRVINVHPSLLPAFAGKMDMDVHQSVLDSGVQETGCTIHFVSQVVDAGPILLQKRCPVLSHDTPQLLKDRVQKLEANALIEAIQLIANGQSI